MCACVRFFLQVPWCHFVSTFYCVFFAAKCRQIKISERLDLAPILMVLRVSVFLRPILFCSKLILFSWSHNQGEKARVIQTLLFVAGVNTLLQALFGTRLPAVVGGSYAYVIPVVYIIFDSSLQRITDHHDVSSSYTPWKHFLASAFWL